MKQRRHVHARSEGFFGLEADDRLLGFFQLNYIEVPSAPGKRGLVQDKTRWVRK